MGIVGFFILAVVCLEAASAHYCPYKGIGFDPHVLSDSGTTGSQKVCPYGFSEQNLKKGPGCPYGFSKSAGAPSKCPYGFTFLPGSIATTSKCPYGYTKSPIAGGPCPHKFNKTNSEDSCPFGFKLTASDETTCPYGYPKAIQSFGCPLGFKKTDIGCPLGLKRGLVEGSKCPFGYTREAALDGKCPLGFSGTITGRGCPLGLRKRSELWKDENSKFSEGTLCPYGFTREAATTPGCPYGYKKNAGGCPFGIKRGFVEGSKCPFGFTLADSKDGKCPVGFLSSDTTGTGCPFGIKKQMVAGSNCPYGFTREDALVRGCPHNFKKSVDGKGCPFGFQKTQPNISSHIAHNADTKDSGQHQIREYFINETNRTLIQNTWKIAKKNGNIAPNSFMLYFKLKPDAQMLFPAFSNVSLTDLPTDLNFLRQTYTCLAGLNAYIGSLGKNPKDCPYLNSPYLKTINPDDLKLFNKVLFNVMEEELGEAFSFEARKVWKDSLIACDIAFRKSHQKRA